VNDIAKTIRGINVKIGSDTSGLSKALKDVNSKSRDIRSELRKVERLLRFNPDDTELLAQKQQLLSDRVENTSEKLRRLKKVQGQIKDQFERGEIDEGQYRAFRREIKKTESKLETFEKQLNETASSSSKLTRKLRIASNKLRSTAVKVGRALKTGLAVGITTAGAAAAKATYDTANYAKEIDNAAKATSASIEAYQELRYALGEVGIQGDEVEEVLTEVNRVIGEAAQGDENMQDRLEAIGFNLEKIEELDTDEAFMQMVDGLSNMESQAKKTAIAGKLLGEDLSRKLMPVIESGVKNIEELRERARELGIVMDEEGIKKAVEFRDSLHELKGAFNGIKRQIALELMPSMQNWADYMLENMPKIRKEVDDIANDIINIVKGFKLLWDVVKLVTEPIIDLIVEIASTVKLLFQNFEQMALQLRIGFNYIQLALAELINFIVQKADILGKIPGGLGEKWKAFSKETQQSTEAVKNHINSLKKDSKRNYEDIEIAWEAMKIGFKDAVNNIGDNVSQLIQDYKSLANDVEETEKQKTEIVKKESQERIKQRKEEVKKAKKAVNGIRIFRREDGPDLITNDPSQLRKGEKWEEGMFLEGSGTRQPVTSTTEKNSEATSKTDSKIRKTNDMMKKLSNQLKSYIKKSLSVFKSMKNNINKITDKLQPYAKNSLKTLNSINNLAQLQTNSLQSIDRKMNKLDSILTALNNLNIDITNQYYNGSSQENSSQNGNLGETLKNRGVGGSHL